MDVVPERIGRYRVIDRLATGGMAEIFLGRLDGPSGFQRLVVVKRALPHLARDPELVEMFLDEARTMSRLRHPNVVQVHELGEGGEHGLFLAMEYLEGESVEGLLRRLHRAGRRLDPELAVHIAAEACRGLQAAHELVDEGGVPLGVVHRDVSPQNLFVTYDGVVKVLDFGIAKAKNHASRTEPGTVRGKFAYMSPEQCLGEALDQRSDIFSLGIVLHELLTQQRLFKRGSHLAQMKAICEEPVPSPRREDIPIPAAVAEACMQALERDRDRRWPSCKALRAALLAAVRGGRVVAPDEALRDLMHDLFADRIADKRALAAQAEAGEVTMAVPRAEVDSDVELPDATATAPDASSLPARTSRSTWDRPGAWLMGGLALLAGGMLAVMRARAPSSPAAEVVAHVTLEVESTPAATVTLDGKPVGTTPLEIELERSEVGATLEIAAPGRVPHRQTVIPSVDQRLVVTLPVQEPAAVEGSGAPVEASSSPPSSRPTAPMAVPRALPAPSPVAPPTPSASPRVDLL
ncbi:MAG: protein kinase [Myxococcales bacterium]|nr:protein kinase [Myxococcales bacterium]